MLLSEMFGVERDTDFMVKGMVCVYKVIEDIDGCERIVHKDKSMDFWKEPYSPLLFEIIAGAPANIIHLPPPLTDEQREQLKAIWTLGGRWLAKDMDGDAFAFSYKPVKDDGWLSSWVLSSNNKKEIMFAVFRELDICNLVSWSDPEPYDIGKALGVEK